MLYSTRPFSKGRFPSLRDTKTSLRGTKQSVYQKSERPEHISNSGLSLSNSDKLNEYFQGCVYRNISYLLRILKHIAKLLCAWQ